jgi:hypothetical protein
MRNYDPFSDLIRSIEENLQRDGGMNDPGDEPRPVEPPRPPRRLPVADFHLLPALRGLQRGSLVLSQTWPGLAASATTPCCGRG